MKQVYEYNQDGSFKQLRLIEANAPIPSNCTAIPLPQPCWKPYFESGQWVEKATEEEKHPPLPPATLTVEQKLESIQQALDELILGGVL